MNEQEFKDRTKMLAIETIRLVENLPKSKTTDIIGRQLLRSATSIGANYRSACRAKSPADMIAKLAIVEEEGDETIYWLELLEDSKIMEIPQLAKLKKQADEIVAMTVASIRTLRRKSGPSTLTDPNAIQNPKSKI